MSGAGLRSESSVVTSPTFPFQLASIMSTVMRPRSPPHATPVLAGEVEALRGFGFVGDGYVPEIFAVALKLSSFVRSPPSVWPTDRRRRGRPKSTCRIRTSWSSAGCRRTCLCARGGASPRGLTAVLLRSSFGRRRIGRRWPNFKKRQIDKKQKGGLHDRRSDPRLPKPEQHAE